MPASDFEFRALENEIRDLRKRLSALERFAPSGTWQDVELPCRSATPDNVIFNGPTGGVMAKVIRINQWAWFQFSGAVTSVGAASGDLFLETPWPLIPVQTWAHTPVGSADAADSSAGTSWAGRIYIDPGTAVHGVSIWTAPASASTQTRFSTTVPFTWAVNDLLRGYMGVCIAPGG